MPPIGTKSWSDLTSRRKQVLHVIEFKLAGTMVVVRFDVSKTLIANYNALYERTKREGNAGTN